MCLLGYTIDFIVKNWVLLSFFLFFLALRKEGRKGKERKGKERKGKERKGKERKGKERKGKERKGRKEGKGRK
jgi:hypothetical protein